MRLRIHLWATCSALVAECSYITIALELLRGDAAIQGQSNVAELILGFPHQRPTKLTCLLLLNFIHYSWPEREWYSSEELCSLRHSQKPSKWSLDAVQPQGNIVGGSPSNARNVSSLSGRKSKVPNLKDVKILVELSTSISRLIDPLRDSNNKREGSGFS